MGGPPGGTVAHYAYDYYSRLAGDLGDAGEAYRVRYRRLNTGGARVSAWLLVATALAFETIFFVWLMRPNHYPAFQPHWTWWLSIAMIVSIAIIEAFRLLGLATLSLATIHARDPLPVHAEPGTRVAFLTTIVPSSEPIELVRVTLEAARRVRHDGTIDVWLLDEGDDPEVRAVCAELGVHHFTRRGVEAWNQPSGRFRARSKHGNYNAWLDAHGSAYDLWLSVDPDHVPLPEMAERMLGWFRDPDVAFVVGPQVYGNQEAAVTRGAESQQYLFHSLLQRAANTFACPMFVGTSNAVRISALQAIGGLSDSITEDAATSIVWHAARNPDTGNRWTSVYTPDVLAVGEGPATWGAYFTQQARWSRGTDEVVIHDAVRAFSGLGWRRRLHYGLLMSFYPTAALTWVLGAFNLMVYLITGVGSVEVAGRLWLMLYLNAAFLQVMVYFWNRQHNVSPHEEAGSSGLSGMLMSVVSAPVYVTALGRSLLRRPAAFVVTPKGSGATAREPLATFARSGHLWWGGALSVAFAVSLLLGHDAAAMRVWASLTLVVCLAPAGMALLGSRGRATPDAVPADPDHPDTRRHVRLVPDPAVGRILPRPRPALRVVPARRPLVQEQTP